MVVVYVKIYQFGCHFGIYFYLCKKKMKVMQVVSAREFRANQGKYLIKE